MDNEKAEQVRMFMKQPLNKSSVTGEHGHDKYDRGNEEDKYDRRDEGDGDQKAGAGERVQKFVSKCVCVAESQYGRHRGLISIQPQ